MTENLRALFDRGKVAAAMSGTPHDALFRASFANAEVARSHLPGLLPAHVAAAIDWTTLRVEPGSFVDEALAQAHSDVLYGVRLCGGEALVYAVFEHQSSFDRWMPLRLLRYVTNVWKRWLGDRGGEQFAPPVIAVVLHHSETGWRAAPELASVFAPEMSETLGNLLPRFSFVLDDISHVPVEELAKRSGHALARLCLLALVSGRDWPRLTAALPHIRAAVVSLPGTPEHREALFRLWRYFYLASPEDVDKEAVRSILWEVAGPEYAEDAMNAAEQLRQEGRAEGRLEGRLEGKLEGRLEGKLEGRLEGKREMLGRFLSVRGIKLSDVGRARVEACADGAQLDEWVLRAANAVSETDVFGA